MSSNPYDQVAPIYDDAFHFKTSQVEDEIVYEWLTRLLHHSTLLDLGCGTGSALEHLPADFGYVGVDSSKSMVRVAHRKFPEHVFIVADMCFLPIKDACFDNVISLYGPISYAGHRAVVEAHRVLRVAGKVFHMAFSHRYRTRKSYILNRLGLSLSFTPYEELPKLSYYHTRGFNSFGDSVERLPKRLIRFLLKHDVPGILHKCWGYFVIIYGEKTE